MAACVILRRKYLVGVFSDVDKISEFLRALKITNEIDWKKEEAESDIQILSREKAFLFICNYIRRVRSAFIFERIQINDLKNNLNTSGIR